MTILDPADSPMLALTDRTECGGCAAKLGADVLADAIAGLGGEGATSELLVGLDPADDAAVYRIDERLAVLGTVDFFPPVVDDPYAYGAIAAANAVSDIFAMGGRVAFALAVAALPVDLPLDVTRRIFQGAADTVREAGGVLAGGHTLQDDEPKYGLAVIGFANPDRLLRKDGARPGDRLVLTKPLGTGLIISGRRQNRGADEWLAGAVASMCRLNGTAADVFVSAGVRAATDVTGFGLIGHSLEMASAAGVRFAVDATRLPALPGALDLARQGVETSGAAHSRRFAAGRISLDDVPGDLVTLAFDPQTSGGLLGAVPPPAFDSVAAGLHAAGVAWTEIGTVEVGSGLRLSA